MPTSHLTFVRWCAEFISKDAIAGVPLDTERVDYAPGSPTRARLLEVNPLGQVPALVLHQGGRDQRAVVIR